MPFSRHRLHYHQHRAHTTSQDLTEGPIWSRILLFAFPIFLGNLFQQFYNTFDSWVVGRYLGDAALAAVSSSASLIHMMVGFFQGIAMGAGVLIAKSFGARDHDSLKRAMHTDVAFGLVAGILLTVLGVAFTPTILRWMKTPDNVLPQSIAYFRYYSYGVLFTVMYNIFVGILHAIGDSKHPLYYLIFSTFINIGLDLLLVGYLGFGVGSAALATTISQGVSALLCCVRLMRGVPEEYRLRLRQIRFDPTFLKSIIKFGLPSGVQNSVIGFANLVVQTNINAFGDAAMAGCGAHQKIEGFAFLPVTCFSMALSTFVGQNLGAKNYDRVKKGVGFGILCSCLMAELIGITEYWLAPKLIGFFANTDVVIEFGTMHMRTICLFYCLLAFSHCIAAIMRGAGKASVPMITMLICWCVIRVTYITVAVKFVNQLTTVSWAYPITWSLSSIVFLIYFLKADWIHNFDRLEAQGKKA